MSRASFDAEWFDRFASVMKKYTIGYYEADGTVEIFEPATRKTFLKRTEPPEAISPSDFYVGGSVTLFSRQFRILGFADATTERKYKVARSATLGIVTSDGVPSLGDIITAAGGVGLSVGRLAMLSITPEQAAALTSTRPPSEASRITSSLLSGPAVLLELIGADAVSLWHGLMGPADPRDARVAAPESLRARFGKSAAANAVYGSASLEDASREISLLFDSELTYTAGYRDCAVCVVKPHAGASLGPILSALSSSGLTVTALRSAHLTRAAAEDYLEAYRGVVDEASAWVSELSSGISYIAEVTGESAVDTLRSLAGPYLPDVARAIAPGSLRATFGTDPVRNGVHVTDLPLDGPLESKYLFHVV